MPTNAELLKRIEELEKAVEAHKQMIILMGEYIKTIPQPENFAELGRYLAVIKGWKPS